MKDAQIKDTRQLKEVSESINFINENLKNSKLTGNKRKKKYQNQNKIWRP